ncbi:MAG: hypothetical protein WBN90_08145 [Gammaproteobacteria bacterium]
MGYLILQGLSGALVGALIFYVAGSLLMRRWILVDTYRLLLCMSAAFLVAIICEVYLGKLYYLFTGNPLWQYRVWPIHDGFTSALNFIVWPVYGYYVYFLNHILQEKKILIRPYWLRGVAAGMDGPLLEILANGFFLLFYGTFYFYYLPGDLRHYTSIQVVPLYIVMGIILSLILEYLNDKPRRWHYPAALYLGGIGFILTG